MIHPKYLVLFSIMLLLVSCTVSADYIKVANNGSALPKIAQPGTAASSWGCVYDSRTQLIWELKSDNNDSRDRQWSYSWFNSAASVSGNMAGAANAGNCYDQQNCDTEKYVQYINSQGLCGAKDWRLPTLSELQSLLNSTTTPAIDPVYFPDVSATRSGIQGFWSSTSVNSTTNSAYYVAYETGLTLSDLKTKLHRIRLVRDAIKFNTTASITNATVTNIQDTLLDQFNFSHRGENSNNLSYVKTPIGVGARFTQAKNSRIEYAGDDLPTSGTIEFLVRIQSAYRSDVSSNEACAQLMISRRTRFYVCKSGLVSMALIPINAKNAITFTVPKTRFRFNEWHLISFSFGQKTGSGIAIDGQAITDPTVGTSTDLTRSEKATIGDFETQLNAKTVHIGFEGVIDALRLSPKEQDWILGKDRPRLSNKLAKGSFKKPNFTPAQAVVVHVNDKRQQHIFGKPSDINWFEFYAKQGQRYSISVPNDSVGGSLNLGLEIYNADGQLVRSLVDEGIQGEGEELIWTASSSGLFRVKISNQPPYSRDATLDNSFELQIFATDLPQQGIVKGTVVNSCNAVGINNAEVAGLLAGNPADSTLTYKTGEFSLLLNPNDYQIKSSVSQYLESTAAVSVNQIDDVELQMQQAPVTSCSNYVAPPLDPALLEQQAVASFSPEDNLLVVRDIVVGEQVFYAELRHLGNFRFEVSRIFEIPDSYHSQPGSYDPNLQTVNLPSVFASNKLYKVQLIPESSGIYVLGAYSELP